MDWPDLLQIIEKLRSPQGCPWDRKQTHQSLKRYLLEESYELFEAIDRNNPNAIVDELGDVLLQILLHAQIGKETQAFTIDDVIQNLAEKLIRRHPHVFAHKEAATPEEVAVHWDDIKKTEKAAARRTSVLDGVPREFPALMRAEKIQRKAAKVGFDWSRTEDVAAKIEEELAEVQEALSQGRKEKTEEELGDLLFAAVNLARFQEIDPEFALQKATAKFSERFRFIEQYSKEKGLVLEEMTLGEMNAIWDQAKAQLSAMQEAPGLKKTSQTGSNQGD
ncbi:MAG: nucleoside triphosphate pyrophosphohydrolase [Firmicutes bacterium]|mgnify:CR=1 FL=1|nr:nucleoside triphosphate pyrophosphohydrolase [Bacillota bacterium]